MNLPGLSRLLSLHVAFSALVVAGLWAGGFKNDAGSFALGAALMQWSCLTLAWVTGRVLTQKQFAWTLAIIVIKYAVLLGTLYSVTQIENLKPLALVVGVFSFMVVALGYAVLETKFETT